MNSEDPLGDEDLRPHALENLAFRHETMRPRDQRDQHLEGLRGEVDALLSAGQLPLWHIEHESSEFVQPHPSGLDCSRFSSHTVRMTNIDVWSSPFPPSLRPSRGRAIDSSRRSEARRRQRCNDFPYVAARSCGAALRIRPSAAQSVSSPACASWYWLSLTMRSSGPYRTHRRKIARSLRVARVHHRFVLEPLSRSRTRSSARPATTRHVRHCLANW